MKRKIVFSVVLMVLLWSIGWTVWQQIGYRWRTTEFSSLERATQESLKPFRCVRRVRMSENIQNEIEMNSDSTIFECRKNNKVELNKLMNKSIIRPFVRTAAMAVRMFPLHAHTHTNFPVCANCLFQ